MLKYMTIKGQGGVMFKIETILDTVINYYSRKELKSINEDIYNENVEPELVWNFIKGNILKNSGNITMNKLNKRTTNIDNFDTDFIGVYSNEDNTNIKVILPRLKNLKSALMYIHEITHYVCLESRKGIKTNETYVDEFIPFVNECYFLRKYYPEEYFNNHILRIRNNVIKYCKDLKNGNLDNIKEKIKYIYSYYLFKQYGYIKEDENIFNEINQSKENFIHELSKQILILNNSIFLFYED